MLRFERALWANGIELVAGIDEAGMSPLAGPVVAAAVILPVECRLAHVDDSKKLSPERRAELAPLIKAHAIAWAVGIVEPQEIDILNIYWAGIAAMQRAVQALLPQPLHLLIDARRLRELALPQDAIVHGDAKSLSIAAASIIAKTTRDARMVGYEEEFPGYGFAQHKGYPVKQHQAALRALGPCAIHRRSFAPVREASELPRGV